ncbi:MAG: flagellar basal body P-ring formation chaperone FlgA [Candidatus Brocadiia bacterium]
MRSAVAAVLVLFAALAAAGEPVTLTLRPTATVDSERVTLGDLAEVDARQGDLAHRLGDIDLGPAPSPGHDRRFTREFLALRLRQEQVEPASVQWAGPAATSVRRAATVLPGEAIAQAAVDEVRAALPWPDEDLIVEVQRPAADLRLRGTGHEVRYTVTTGRGRRLLGTVPVQVTVQEGARVVGHTSVLLNVRVFQRVLVARRRLRRGQRITKDDVQFQRTELTSLGNEAIGDLAEALGKECRQPLPAFAVLTRRVLAPARVVRRGSLVSLVVEAPGMRITARGIAQQDGAVGEVIGVVNVDSRKVVQGHVVDGRTVQVPF